MAGPTFLIHYTILQYSTCMFLLEACSVHIFSSPLWHCNLSGQHLFSPLWTILRRKGTALLNLFVVFLCLWLPRVRRWWCIIYSEPGKGQACFPECCCSDVMVAGVKTVGFLRLWWHTVLCRALEFAFENWLTQQYPYVKDQQYGVQIVPSMEKEIISQDQESQRETSVS